jgi:4-carboxymuconolactone decarboxylase
VNRIPPLEAPLPATVAQRMSRLVPPSMMPPQLFRAVARNEGLFNFLVDSRLLGPTGLLDRRAIDAALREALILRVCVACGNDYEWQLHVGTISARLGLSPEQIADTRAPLPDAKLWPAATLLAMALADALVATRCVGDVLFATLRRHFDDSQLIELTQLIGLYTGVAMMVALVQPALDDYAAPLPQSNKV